MLYLRYCAILIIAAMLIRMNCTITYIILKLFSYLAHSLSVSFIRILISHLLISICMQQHLSQTSLFLLYYNQIVKIKVRMRLYWSLTSLSNLPICKHHGHASVLFSFLCKSSARTLSVVSRIIGFSICDSSLLPKNEAIPRLFFVFMRSYYRTSFTVSNRINSKTSSE